MGVDSKSKASNKNLLATVSPNSGVGAWLTGSFSAATRPSGTLTETPPTGLTFTTTNTSPLDEDYSFTFTKDSSNRQGTCVYIPFTVKKASRAKVLTIELDYIVDSGTFVAGSNGVDSDVIVYIQDVTNGTLIQPSSFKLLSNSTSIGDKFSATFQTSSNGSTYRLILYVATTSTSTYTLKLNNIEVKRSTYVYGTPITDWTSYTPTISAGFGTATGISFFYRRAGDSLEGYGKFTAGTTAASVGTFTLPSGLSIDSTKIVQMTAVGKMFASASPFSGGIGAFPSTSTTLLYITSDSANPNAVTNGNTWANSTLFGFHFKVPIAGWSSSVQMSDSADTRVVAGVAYRNTSQTITTGGSAQKVQIDTKEFDTHGAFDISTNYRYVVPVSGIYTVTGSIEFAANATGRRLVYIYKNGTAVAIGNSTVNSGTYTTRLNVTKSIQANAGDYFELYAFQDSGGDLAVNGASEDSYLSVSKVSGPSAIAASETVAARYNSSAGQSITGGVTAIMNYGTKEYDTHGAVTTGASWKFTAPIPGKYRVQAAVYSGSVAWATSNQFLLSVYKNGVWYTTLWAWRSPASNTYRIFVNGSSTLHLNAGEYIDIRVDADVTNTIAVDEEYVYTAIERVGN